MAQRHPTLSLIREHQSKEVILMKYEKPQLTVSASATKIVHGMDGKPNNQFWDAAYWDHFALTVGAYEVDE